MNEYELDVNYFKEKLSLILRDIGCYRPEEMHRELSRLADVVAPAQAKRIAELEQNSRDFTELCKVNDEAIAGYIAKIKELEARESIAITHLTQVVEEMNFLMNDSQGVAGLHLNGDIAKRESLLRGGSDDSWLTYLSEAADFVQNYRVDNKGDSK